MGTKQFRVASTSSKPLAGSTRIRAEELSTGYGEKAISDSVTVDIPAHGFTVIIGPNACGKSTLLRTIARIQAPLGGSVLLDGKDVHRTKTRQLARRLGLLPQAAVVPERMIVRDLVARGRSPHQGIFNQWSKADHEAVIRAMELTRVTDLADAGIDELSGGQRQRVWLAMVLAQDTETVLLDEPTTFLDLAHQMELLELCKDLYTAQGRTVVAVLHDLNQAARFGTHLIAMKSGEILASGTPEEVITEGTMREVFGLDALVMPDPVTGSPLVIPRGRTLRSGTLPVG
ncbi:ABC transporter ATP-binding protein [uncultured Corynebacterium sp.]|uniref:ABC transporter ATP-binding protein n=1 Tax=uncultured Corynebacterium sp. TaxID=159447 RepID=UPI00288A336D|nr:ABC transporter ATP-binding protein [uncultured Corynebacterium sp.]